jgi:hypothetical protein
MVNATQIEEHAQVVGSCGKHVGTVDRVEGRLIKLAKDDPTSGGRHHYVPLAWVKSAGLIVYLNKSAAETREMWDGPVGLLRPRQSFRE